jgi:hypothetical protein
LFLSCLFLHPPPHLQSHHLNNHASYYLEEKKGNINYLGWVGRQDQNFEDDCNMVSVKFQWDDADATVEVKPISTILCGSTVQFEVAALTMAFLAGEQVRSDYTLSLAMNTNFTLPPSRVSPLENSFLDSEKLLPGFREKLARGFEKLSWGFEKLSRGL